MTVTGCEDCPMGGLGHSTEGWYVEEQCYHPDGKKRVVWREAVAKGPPPDWCPLRTAPLTIALDMGGVEGDVFGHCPGPFPCGHSEAERRKG